MKRSYECMFVIKADLNSEDRDEIFEKITKKVESLNGKVQSSKIWAKERNFYYFLRSRGAEKTKCYKGCYWLLNFLLDKEKLFDLKETIRLEERILRNLIVSREKQKKAKLTTTS